MTNDTLVSPGSGRLSAGLQLVAVLLLTSILGFQVFWRIQARDEVAELRDEIASPRWEYTTIDFVSAATDRSGPDAMRPASIDVDARRLTILGAQGWEITASYLENETAYPNFGDSKYVTGLQPNVRPQRLVLILRRRLG